MRLRKVGVAFVCGTAALGAGAAMAQDPARPPARTQAQGASPADAAAGTNASATSAQGDSQLQEVVVTAQKRSENLQLVPLAVSALSQADLKATNVRDFGDYVRFLPGVTFTSLDQSSRGTFIPVVRGVQLPGASASAPTTGFYLGEVPVTGLDTLRNGVPNPNTFDLDRIEVLRGPQGTLYGASALGGVIKVVPNAPDPTRFSGEVQAEANGTSSGGAGDRVDAMVNVPIIKDHLAFRITGYQERDAGYKDQLPLSNLAPGTTTYRGRRNEDVNGADQSGFRAALKADYGDFTGQLSVDHQLVREGSSPRISAAALGAFGTGNPTTFAVDSEPQRFSFTLGSLELKYNLHWADITSITGLYHSNASNSFGLSGLNAAVLGPSAATSSNLLLNRESEDAVTQEVRFATKLSGPVNALVGFFYSDGLQHLSQFAIDPIYTPVFGTPDLFSQQGTRSSLSQKAVFVNVTWQVTPKLELQAGGRFFDYSIRSHQKLDGVFGAPTPFDTRYSEDGAIPSFTASYKVTKDVLAFLHAAEGFRPGYSAGTVVYPDTCTAELRSLGYNTNTIAQNIRSDSLWNYEGGFKTEWLDHRLRVNVTGYSEDWTNLPAGVNLQCGFAVASNLGKARINGAELEAAATPSSNWLLQISATFTDAHLGSGGSSLGGTDGQRLPITPEVSGSAAVEYHRPILTMQGFVRTDVTSTGPSSWQFNRAVPGGRRPPLTLVNVRLGLRRDDWEVALFARNALDEVKGGYCPPGAAGSVPLPDYTTCVNEPRTFGATVNKRF